MAQQQRLARLQRVLDFLQEKIEVYLDQKK